MNELYKTIVVEVVKDSLKHLSENANNNVKYVTKVFYENPTLVYKYLEKNNVFNYLSEENTAIIKNIKL